jgi:hypothetical protein
MTDEAASEMERRIDEVLHKEKSQAHLILPPRTPLEELMRKEDGGDEEWDEMRWEARLEAFRLMLEFFYQAGPDPLQVLRHVMALTKAVNPALLGDMSLEDISIICADGGRATVSARIKRIYNGTLAAAGMEARASFQKTGNFSEPQKGNKNRVAKERRKIKRQLGGKKKGSP